MITHAPEQAEGPRDFSLVLGGPLFQILRRAHLSGNSVGELLARRCAVICLVAWLPLLLLSVVDGHAFSGVPVPFLLDIEAHVRFLLALAVLILAEVTVHERILHVVNQFTARRLIAQHEAQKFQDAVDFATRARNSVVAETLLLVLVYTLGLRVWQSGVAMGQVTWYSASEGTSLHMTLAGYWYAFVSIPVFQFILLRWYLRLFIWFAFLFKVSRLQLRLTATHPDLAGGLGFLAASAHAFTPVLFAQGALLAGLIANRIFHEGRTLLAFKMEIVGLVGVAVVVVLMPLAVFAGQLVERRRQDQLEYGLLASRYVQGFDDKWVHGRPPSEALLGNSDIQSLCDMGECISRIGQTRMVPFGRDTVLQLAAAVVAPVLPLVLTMFSLEQVLERVVKTVLL